MAKNCRVYCKDLDIWFKTITAASKYAGVKDWSMSKKMESAGSFVDDAGHIYIREKPMKTKNRYKNTGSTLKRRVGEVKQQQTPFAFLDLPKPVQELITEKINDMLNNDVPFSQVKTFMIKMGCKKLTLNLN